jgi:hypothetical protein
MRYVLVAEVTAVILLMSKMRVGVGNARLKPARPRWNDDASLEMAVDRCARVGDVKAVQRLGVRQQRFEVDRHRANARVKGDFQPVTGMGGAGLGRRVSSNTSPGCINKSTSGRAGGSLIRDLAGVTF